MTEPTPTGDAAPSSKELSPEELAAAETEQTKSAPAPSAPEPAPAAEAAPEAAAMPSEDAEKVNQELEAALEGGDLEAMVSESLDAPAEEAAKDDVVHTDFVRARVMAVRGEDVFVEPMTALPNGQKLQGVVPLSQFERPPRIGAVMEFLIDRIDGREGLIHLNREGAVQNATWQRIERGMAVEARVIAANKGGLELEMPGQIRAFMPASQVDIGHIEDLEVFVGQKVEARVHEVDRKHKRVIISRREHQQKQRDLLKAKTMEELQEGSVVKGTINKLTDFGAFVDIGGVDGLLHISDMSHSRIGKPSEVVKKGDQVEVKVLKIDKAKGRISLGLKQIAPDPWTSVTFTPGEEVSGRITRTAPFGCFVEVADGIEGLLPISEMSWKRIGKAEDVVKVGEIVKLKIMQVDLAKKKMSLSIKQAAGDPWADTSEYEVGELVEGTVVTTTEFGAFVELKPGVEGMVHISELDNKRVNVVTDIIKKGDTKQFRVIGMELEKRRIKLSLKQVAKMDDRQQKRAQEDADADKIKKEAKARLKPKSQLKGGGLDSSYLGTGLGGLKL